MKRVRRWMVGVLVLVFGLGFVLVAAASLSDAGIPPGSQSTETLSEADKIRLAEARHLREMVGDAIWPGWAQMDIPVLSYNEAYAFLVGYAQPPAGWVETLAGEQRGGAWEVVDGELFDGQAYYRQRLTDPELMLGNSTVLVGDRWVVSIQTSDWMKMSLLQTIRDGLPAALRPVFPYRLFIDVALESDDKYVSLIAHESFRAYQGQRAPAKFAAAESAAGLAAEYPWRDPALQAAWQAEFELLSVMLRNNDRATLMAQARQFLTMRAARREAATLTPELVAYEFQREWVEGLARYTELEAWREGSLPSYKPLPAADDLAEFEDYQRYASHWGHELEQLPRMAAAEGDGRFRYSGMAQAYLLDRLMPGWKERAFDEGVWLETLLEEALAGS